MTSTWIAEAGLQFPVLAFPPDDDVFPFEHLGLLLGKSTWWEEQGRLSGVEIVDSADRRWRVSGVVEREQPKRHWWQFGRRAEPSVDIDLQPLDPEPFTATRHRVEMLAGRIFSEGDDALSDIRAATDMGGLSEACFEIVIRAQGLRILAGEHSVPVRSATAAADRALVLATLVQISAGADRIKGAEWLDKNGLFEAITQSESRYFATMRLSDEQRAEAGWNVESLIALLWALGFIDQSPAEGEAELSDIIDIVPPMADISVEEFRAAARLRPSHELAQMAEICRNASRDAERNYGDAPSDETANAADALYRRYTAIQWLLNPDRLEWQ